MRTVLLAGVLLAAVQANAVAGGAPADPLDAAVAAETRSEKNLARDKYRHPAETLRFFQVHPGMTVVEIWPGGGWYTEILAPLLAKDGQLYTAVFSDKAEGQPAYRARLNQSLRNMFAAHPDVYGNVEITHLHVPGETDIAPAGSADRVLTFRNVHNWLAADDADAVFAAFFAALKPGGLLGVVEHRAKPGADLETMKTSGYVTEEKVVELAREAGFELVEKSEINANPKDTADHPKGVWTLPPSLRLGDEDREKYLAIGESDRMTLLFRKPAE
ncbi:MAG TPA: methyltransferase [Gammaproteobacteria bacterium]